MEVVKHELEKFPGSIVLTVHREEVMCQRVALHDQNLELEQLAKLVWQLAQIVVGQQELSKLDQVSYFSWQGPETSSIIKSASAMGKDERFSKAAFFYDFWQQTG